MSSPQSPTDNFPAFENSGQVYQSMTALPDELVEIICRFVRLQDPFPWPSQSLRFKNRRRALYDLMSLRLTCKKLHRVVTPLAWARLDLSLRSTCIAGGTFIVPFYRVWTVLDALITRPDLAKHVRTLSLTFDIYEESPDLRSAQQAIERLLRVMPSLRVFRSTTPLSLTKKSARYLVSLPSMRILCIDQWSRLHGFDGFGIEDVDLSHLEAFKLPSSSATHKVLSRTRNLKAVILEKGCTNEWPVDGTCLPWETLRELSLLYCSDADLKVIFADHVAFCRGANGSALQELCLRRTGNRPELMFIHNLVLAFKGANLRTLFIFDVTLMSHNILSLIVDAFPSLVELTLYTNADLDSWPDSYSGYAVLLKSVSRLQVLDWNNVYVQQSGDPAVQPRPRVYQRDINYYLPGLQLLASHNPYLNTVWHTARSFGIYDCCVIQRTEDGDVQDCKVFQINSEDCDISYVTSAWADA